LLKALFLLPDWALNFILLAGDCQSFRPHVALPIQRKSGRNKLTAQHLSNQIKIPKFNPHGIEYMCSRLLVQDLCVSKDTSSKFYRDSQGYRYKDEVSVDTTTKQEQDCGIV
jgi:hypothetical protein